MGSNSFLQKCGQLFVDVRSKNKKSKIYIFQCTFCDMQCDQLKKFSLHIGEEHLNDFDEIVKEAPHLKDTNINKETEFLKETELKFEAEPEEFNNIEETPDIKVCPSPIDSKMNINADPLDTVVAASTSANADNLNREIKYEIIEHDNDMEFLDGAGDMEFMDGTVSISDSSDKSDSDDAYMAEIPHKKRKTKTNVKKGNQTKRKENSNETESDESKDVESNVMKARLTRAEIQKRYRQKLKQDEKRYADYKRKARERTSKQPKRGEMCLQRLQLAREKAKLRYYKQMTRLRKRKNGCSKGTLTGPVSIDHISSACYFNNSVKNPFINYGPAASFIIRTKKSALNEFHTPPPPPLETDT